MIVLCCLAVIIIAAILGLTGAFQDILSFLPFFPSQSATVEAIPADAGFCTTANLSTRDMEGFQHLADVYEDAFEDEVEDRLEEVEDQYDISFEDDVQTWIGPEISIAILNLKDMTEDDDDPLIVVVAVTRDRKASGAFLEKLKDAIEDKGYDVEEETYKDVTFYAQEVKEEWETPLVFGTMGNLVVLASDIEAMEDVIDTYKGEREPLAENERYTEVMKELPSDAAMATFIDVEDLQPALDDLTAPGYGMGGIVIGSSGIAGIEAYKAIGLAVTLDKEGIQIDAAVTFDPDELPPEVVEFMKNQASPGHILERVPDDTLAFISAQDLATAWRNTVEANPDLEDTLKDLSETWGIDVDEEFFSWATDEFALALTNVRDDIGFFAIFEVSDPDAAMDAMDELANDPNIPLHGRTLIWNIISQLETIK